MNEGAQPGNTNATKGKVWSDAIRKELISSKKLSVVAKKLVTMAENGDLGAIKECGDRLDGKAHQSADINLDGQVTVIEQAIFGDKSKATKQLGSP